MRRDLALKASWRALAACLATRRTVPGLESFRRKAKRPPARTGRATLATVFPRRSIDSVITSPGSAGLTRPLRTTCCFGA